MKSNRAGQNFHFQTSTDTSNVNDSASDGTQTQQASQISPPLFRGGFGFVGSPQHRQPNFQTNLLPPPVSQTDTFDTNYWRSAYTQQAPQATPPPFVGGFPFSNLPQHINPSNNTSAINFTSISDNSATIPQVRYTKVRAKRLALRGGKRTTEIQNLKNVAGEGYQDMCRPLFVEKIIEQVITQQKEGKLRVRSSLEEEGERTTIVQATIFEHDVFILLESDGNVVNLSVPALGESKMKLQKEELEERAMQRMKSEYKLM